MARLVEDDSPYHRTAEAGSATPPYKVYASTPARFSSTPGFPDSGSRRWPFDRARPGRIVPLQARFPADSLPDLAAAGPAGSAAP
jgi:hypothetical protein